MNKKIIKRVIEEAKYMLDTNKTVREIASVFGVSKSTVHKDLSDRLLTIDASMYNDVVDILRYHTSIRHIRGGEATRVKFFLKNAN